MDRRAFLGACAAAGLSASMAEALWNRAEGAPIGTSPPPAAERRVRVTREMIAAAEGLLGLSYTDAQRDLMIEALEHHLAAHEMIRRFDLPNAVLPAMQFSARLPGARYAGSRRGDNGRRSSRPGVRRPMSNTQMAFLSVVELAELLRSRQVTSTELTLLYLRRLKQHDSALQCVVTLTEQRALRQAAEADREIAAGRYRGPLHGIPYGVKDALAVAGYPTTWGAAIYRDRVLDTTATVVERLDAAGAVLIAKLSMGELGLSDVWYGGQTKNPWRPGVGATGSSSGSATATAAGLVAFAIGAETMGSIIGPASRNGVTALRPTFGRVSRHGALTLCWSLDKLGPMTRSVEDCAVILEAIAGPDGRDPTCETVSYAWDPDRPLSAVRVGYFREAFDADRPTKANDDAALDTMRSLAARLVAVALPTDLPINSMLIVRTEAAAALDEVARSGGLDHLMVQEVEGWPNFIRASRFVPAVEYLQASRLRTLLMQRMHAIFNDVDVFLAPTFGVIPVTNLTGNPCVVVPNGFGPDRTPASISFIGRLFGESELCTVARAFQHNTPWNKLHPAPFAEQ